jgi:hypothetical protein
MLQFLFHSTWKLPKQFLLLFERARRLLSHLCQICLALVKVQKIWKYLAISGGNYPTALRKHGLIFIITERLLSHLCQICLALLQVQQFWKYHAISGGKYLKISRYFRTKISYCSGHHELIFIFKKDFCPIYVRFVLLYCKYSSFENITLFQEEDILLLTENMNLFLF